LGKVASHGQNKKDWGKCQIKEKLKGLSPVKYRTKSDILVLLLYIVLFCVLARQTIMIQINNHEV